MYSKKIALLFSVLLIGLLISGCFEFEERIILKKDGSGTLEIEYWTWKDADINTDSFNMPKEKEAIRDEIEEKYTSDRIKLTKFKVNDKDKSRHVRFKLAFNQITDLNEIPQFQRNQIQFKKSGKKIQFKRTIYVKDNESDKKEESDNFFEKIILALVEEGLSNIKFRFELETPYKIVDTNANWNPDEKSAIWKYRLSDVMYQKEVEMTVTTE